MVRGAIPHAGPHPQHNPEVRAMNNIRIRENKPPISAEAKTFRAIRRLNLNRTYMPLKIGAIAGYILLGMLSASTSMFGILVGAVLRMVGL
jgi:hypothetical protein